MHLRLIALVMLVGCGKDTAKDTASAEEEDPGLAYVVKGVTEDVPLIKAAIASPKPGDGRYKCAHMANIKDLEASAKHKPLAAELRQLCTKDLHVAIIKAAVEAAEAARTAKPDEKVLSECYSGELETAKGELTEYGTLDAAKGLLARLAVACPTAK